WQRQRHQPLQRSKSHSLEGQRHRIYFQFCCRLLPRNSARFRSTLISGSRRNKVELSLPPPPTPSSDPSPIGLRVRASRIRVSSVRIEQLFAINLVVGDSLLSFR